MKDLQGNAIFTSRHRCPECGGRRWYQFYRMLRCSEFQLCDDNDGSDCLVDGATNTNVGDLCANPECLIFITG